MIGRADVDEAAERIRGHVRRTPLVPVDGPGADGEVLLKLEQLQRNLILSHSVGTGELVSDAVCRLIMLMKIGSLARGFSGVRPLIIDTLIAIYNAGIMPAIPAKGSVGASGDLAPVAQRR